MFLGEYEKKLKEISKQENLFCLSDFKFVKFDNKDAMDFLNLISKTRYELNKKGKFDLLTHDLIHSISADIKFSLSNIFLYSPLANNFLKERVSFGNKEHSTYFKTLEDRRFFYYIHSTFEKLYNFWDRIGDLLSMAFKINLPERDIFFSKVIDKLGEKNLNSEFYNWLKDFKENNYKQYLNKERIKIVHYTQTSTYYFFEWLESVSRDNELEIITKLQKEKDDLPKLLKEQLEITNKGFENMIRLIAETGDYE